MKNAFCVQCVMTDRHSGQEIKHLQMIQIELPRARHNVFPPKKDFNLTDWWLSIFKFAPNYTHEVIADFEKQGIVMPSVIAQALERLYFPKWNPREIHEYKTDTIEKEKYAVEFASERAEGKAEGEQIGLEKGEQIGLEKGEHIWGDKKAREVAKRMIIDGMPLQKISQLTELSIEAIQVLAAEVEVNLDEDA